MTLSILLRVNTVGQVSHLAKGLPAPPEKLFHLKTWKEMVEILTPIMSLYTS